LLCRLQNTGNGHEFGFAGPIGNEAQHVLREFFKTQELFAQALGKFLGLISSNLAIA